MLTVVWYQICTAVEAVYQDVDEVPVKCDLCFAWRTAKSNDVNDMAGWTCAKGYIEGGQSLRGFAWHGIFPLSSPLISSPLIPSHLPALCPFVSKTNLVSFV